MNERPPGHRKVLEDIDRLLAQAPDDATRRELEALRERLNTPEMVELARDLGKPRASSPLVLEFHDPLLPTMLTATGCVVATAICLFAIVDGFKSPVAYVGERQINLWVVAAFAGAFSVLFTALSFVRSFSVRVDDKGMASRVSGARWRGLRVGAIPWEQIRSLRERVDDRILEVRAAGGALLEIPMRVVNFGVLRGHLENMVLLYGDRGAGVGPRA